MKESNPQMSAQPSNEQDFLCGSCGQVLGGIANFGERSALQIRLSCPCGGVSDPVALGDIYQARATGILTEDDLRRQLERAIDVHSDSRPRDVREGSA